MTRQTINQACRSIGCTAPETADHATLHRTSNEALLTAHASLTHRIHEFMADRGPDDIARLRDQRDLVQAEALRRMQQAAGA